MQAEQEDAAVQVEQGLLQAAHKEFVS